MAPEDDQDEQDATVPTTGDGEGEPDAEGVSDEGAVDEGAVDGEDTVVVSAEIQPETDEVVDVQPEPAPEPERLHGVPVGHSRGQVVLHPGRDEYLDLVLRLREAGYWACLDLVGVDYLGYAPDRHLPIGVTAERFEVVAMFINHTDRSRIRVRVQVPETDPTVPSLVQLHPGVEYCEREAFDMFGIVFEGHPDPSRILMPDEWEGHPLRKDHAVGRIPVQFKGTASGQ